MQKRQLGKTGLMVTPISFGALPIQRCDMGEAEKVLNKALDCGINFFDTAHLYTDSQEKIGRFISKRRNEFHLATKSMARTKEAMAADIENSLKVMQTDYIDLYQVHNAKSQEILDQLLAPDGALAALKEAKAAGKIGHIGVTGHSLDMLVKAVKTNEFETVQFAFNCVEQEALKELYPLAKSMNVGCLAMKPLGGGLIERKDLALRFVLEHDAIVAIPGMDTVEYVETNILADKNFKPLTAEERATLDAEAKALGANFCRRCGYCLPCPIGIEIPLMFLAHLEYSRYGLTEVINKRYANYKIRASNCVECGECEERCPYNLPIRERLKAVAAVLE